MGFLVVALVVCVVSLGVVVVGFVDIVDAVTAVAVNWLAFCGLTVKYTCS